MILIHVLNVMRINFLMTSVMLPHAMKKLVCGIWVDVGRKIVMNMKYLMEDVNFAIITYAYYAVIQSTVLMKKTNGVSTYISYILAAYNNAQNRIIQLILKLKGYDILLLTTLVHRISQKSFMLEGTRSKIMYRDKAINTTLIEVLQELWLQYGESIQL